jgi:hypothetical protein
MVTLFVGTGSTSHNKLVTSEMWIRTLRMYRYLIAFALLIALLLAGCGAKEAAPLAVNASAQAGDLAGEQAREAKAVIQNLLAEQVEKQDILGMVMAVRLADGSVIWDASGFVDPNGKERWDAVAALPIASVTKTFTAVVIMQLVEGGKLSLDDTVDNWFPDQPWVLSKPVTRTAFVVSRLAVNAIAILFTSVIVPGVILYITLGLFRDLGWLSPFGFLAALVMFSLQTFYWIALVLMMGTLFESSGGVIAVPMALFFIFWMGPELLPILSYESIYVSPFLLTFSPVPVQMNSLAGSFITGEPVFSWLPLISTVVSCVIFIAVAIWRFNPLEY